jgi:glycosyltransferase involved in cell wall biosynthesis
VSGRLGRPDVVVDVGNGVPFWSPLVRRGPVLSVVHHVHREQWPAVMGPVAARIGWWLESQAAPRVYRDVPTVAVSEVTRDELVSLGLRRDRIAVVHNGTEPAGDGRPAPAPLPTLCILGRLVPHKRVDHALEALARLRPRFPGLSLDVVGTGWAADDFRTTARSLGVEDDVTFTGFVDEDTKHDLLARSWVHLCPSVKEGWGLSVMEAAAHGVPTVAYRDAGGLSESIVDGDTGLLVEPTLDAFVAGVERLLRDDEVRARMGARARARSAEFTWARTVLQFESALRWALEERPAVSGSRTPREADLPARGSWTRRSGSHPGP